MKIRLTPCTAVAFVICGIPSIHATIENHQNPFPTNTSCENKQDLGQRFNIHYYNVLNQEKEAAVLNDMRQFFSQRKNKSIDWSLTEEKNIRQNMNECYFNEVAKRNNIKANNQYAEIVIGEVKMSFSEFWYILNYLSPQRLFLRSN